MNDSRDRKIAARQRQVTGTAVNLKAERGPLLISVWLFWLCDYEPVLSTNTVQGTTPQWRISYFEITSPVLEGSYWWEE